jgi:hypothetical protein
MAAAEPLQPDLIDRRRLLFGAGAAAAAVLVPLGGALAAAPDRLLRQAQSAAGGRDVLERVRLLEWEGEAVVHAPDGDLALGMSTIVVPFVTARATGWPIAMGKAAARTMIITPEGGRVEQGGVSTPLSPRFAAHERAQFAMYGLMLLQFDSGRAGLRRVARLRDLSALRVDHPYAPKTRLYFESDGRLAEARNVVPAPEGGGPIHQHFYFSQEQMPGPVRWPRTIRIEQEGKPYFELTLKRFEAAI